MLFGGLSDRWEEDLINTQKFFYTFDPTGCHDVVDFPPSNVRLRAHVESALDRVGGDSLSLRVLNNLLVFDTLFFLLL